MTVTVIIVTLNRASCVQKCLEHLCRQRPRPEQIIVVDASADDLTLEVVQSFDGIQYYRNSLGYGHMSHGRNIGIKHATGEIIAFVDDDAYVHAGWSCALVEPYSDIKVGGVGGRALNNQPNEAEIGVAWIGKLCPNGALTGHFAADPGAIIDVDHIIGCNMSWRRFILTALGGLREDYPGTEVREETDIAIRVRALGYRIVFQPKAVVTHQGAPQVRGRRFDTRYAYYASRNHSMLIARHFGFFRLITWRNAIRELYGALAEMATRLAATGARLGARLLGLIVGSTIGLWLSIKERNRARPKKAERLREPIGGSSY